MPWRLTTHWKRQGLAIRFRVRETPDWKKHVTARESEMPPIAAPEKFQRSLDDSAGFLRPRNGTLILFSATILIAIFPDRKLQNSSFNSLDESHPTTYVIDEYRL